MLAKFARELIPEAPEQAPPEIQRARSNLLDFTLYTKDDYEVNWHHALLCQYLDRWHNGEVPRLIVSQPPQTGKSELVSRRLPAYILGKDPDARIITCSYGADLASSMNRDVQRIIDAPEYMQLFPDTRLFASNIRTVAPGTYLRNSDIFEIVGHRGYYKSAGVGGSITGRGATYLIIDDPLRNRKDAESATIRQAIWEWYTSTLYTRQSKDVRILLTMTRWHEDDLAGRLIELAQTEPGADQWTSVVFPAIAEEDNRMPEDPRQPGEALWPDRYSVAMLMRTKLQNLYDWEALYQQRPRAAKGAIWKREYWRFYDVRPRCQLIIQAWDTGFKDEQANDYSVCTTWGLAEHGIYLLDRYRAKLEFPQLVGAAKSTYEAYKPQVLLVEDHASGQSLIQVVRQDTRLPILARKMEVSKTIRAWAVVGLAQSGRVFLPARAAWLSEYLTEMEQFPSGKHDDQVDSTTLALNYLRPMMGDHLAPSSDVTDDRDEPPADFTVGTADRASLSFGRGSDLAPWSPSRWNGIRKGHRR